MSPSTALTLCICTSGRPVELRRCLDSIEAGTLQPFEVVVSDDSADNATATAVHAACEAYAFTLYVDGPRRGLCANRNHAIRAATGTHLSLLDDDATVGREFVELATALAASARPKQILSGDVLEDGVQLTPPTNPTFLGHFGRPVLDGEPLHNVNLNCNVFPRAAFDDACFDESIVYGYEDMDLCAQLIAKGWTIRHVPELVNVHLPPISRTNLERFRQAEAARLRVLRRRWFVHRRRPFVGSLVLLAVATHAAAHRVAHAFRASRLPNPNR